MSESARVRSGSVIKDKKVLRKRPLASVGEMAAADFEAFPAAKIVIPSNLSVCHLSGHVINMFLEKPMHIGWPCV